MLINIVSIIALVLALSGNLLINFQKRTGYIIWIMSNIAWIIFNIVGYTNIPQIIMYCVYVFLNVHGFIMWSKKKNHLEKEDKT